ncbi:hypothetical protein [Pedobacter paludis]|uniref:Uncharacterized protein n=1 Tax=Pedobacter paludis TaxID=2203212 RepID=A0A317F572_9SPHI|nr:hypothetical protein [Pedobacter paludis]PWS32638.1 hypothetical protein DF947_06075 [Pedobacter paludis]
MNELKRIFHELFRKEPTIVKIPSWSHYSPKEFILANGIAPIEYMHIALSPRTDSQFHFYNDSLQSHISGMVREIEGNNGWSAPMESVAKQMIKEALPIRGFDFYLMGMPKKNKGKTYELLVKAGTALALNEAFDLGHDRLMLSTVVSRTNGDSILDTLFLSQIFQHSEITGQRLEKI